MSRGFFGGSNVRCPHSKFRIEEGYTKRAKSYYSWFVKKKKEYGEELVDKLEIQDSKLSIVGGDYVYLPYAHLKNYVNQIEGIINEHFIKIEEFTAQKVYEIFNFNPRALLDNGIIGSYQNKEVPKFIQHLKEIMPNIYEDFVSQYPDCNEQIEEKVSDYRGRTAKISSLKEESIIYDCHSNGWLIRNNQLVCEKCNTTLMIPFGNSNTVTKIVIDITDDMTYKITDNSVVGKKTVFID